MTLITENNPASRLATVEPLRRIQERFDDIYATLLTGAIPEGETAERVVSKVFGKVILQTLEELAVNQAILLGRGNENRDVSFSRLHCLLVTVNGKQLMIDLGGLGGTKFDFITKIRGEGNVMESQSLAAVIISDSQENNSQHTENEPQSQEYQPVELANFEQHGIVPFVAGLVLDPRISDVVCSLGPNNVPPGFDVPDYRQYIFTLPSQEQQFSLEEYNQLFSKIVDNLKKRQLELLESPDAVKFEFANRLERLVSAIRGFSRRYFDASPQGLIGAQDNGLFAAAESPEIHAWQSLPEDELIPTENTMPATGPQLG